MSRRSQDIPIRPRYGYSEEADGEDASTSHNKQRNNACTPASYSEIPFLAQYAGAVPEHVLQDLTPTAGKVPPEGSDSYQNLDSGDDDNEEEEEDEDEDPSNSNSKDSKDSSNELSKHSSRLQATQSSFPYELEGAIAASAGAMHHFVAHNLESKLRAASEQSNISDSAPISRFLQSRNVPEVDGNVLSDIELEAQYLASSVDNLIENLGNLLHSISSITADNVEVHKNAVKKLTDALDANIKCQYQLLAKTEEISKSMRPTEQLSVRIREIKRLVDMLDSSM